MSKQLKQKTFKSILWSASERFSVQGIQFILGLILARLLSPSDYGLVGMLAIFIAISQVFVDSGFTQALIQKKNRTEIDFSTVFYFNIIIAIIFYVILFFSAPFIASFFNSPILINLTRMIGLSIIIRSFSIVQQSKLVIALNFKTQAKASLLSVLISGVLGIVLAYKGYGVWSLVYQTIIRNILNTIFLWFFSKWKPLKVFSKKSLKELFSFGSKLLIVGLIDTSFINIYQLIIGKIFNAESLGFYTRAKQFQQLPSQNITGILQRVTFPVFSNLQDNNVQLSRVYKKTIKLSAFIVFPLMIGMASLSSPLIKVVLTDKWLPVAALLQLLCIGGMLYPIHALNLNILNVKGRSDLFLKLEIIKKIIIIIIIAITFSFSMKIIIIGQVISSILAFFINTYYSERIIGYGTYKQIKDLFPMILISFIMGSLILFCNQFISQDIFKLIGGIILGVVVYLGLAIVLKFDEISEIKSLLFQRSKNG